MRHQQAIADSRGDIDLARSARDNVHLHELLPESGEANIGIGGRFGLGSMILVDAGVTLGIERELERLHAVILREVRHKCSQGIGRRRVVGKNVAKRGRLMGSHNVPGRSWP